MKETSGSTGAEATGKGGAGFDAKL
jgi:hypothetical protein